MKKIAIFFIILVVVSVTIFFSCEKIADAWFFPNGKEMYKLPQSCSFRVSKMDSLFITTLKKAGVFYVIFSKDSLANLSESQDYVKFETSDMGDIGIVFNPNEKNNIYIKSSNYLDSVNVVNYNLQVLEQKDYYSLFYKPGIKTAPDTLKYPYVSVHIITMSHLIFESKYQFVQTRIK
jgi:hypothetical protein